MYLVFVCGHYLVQYGSILSLRKTSFFYLSVFSVFFLCSLIWIQCHLHKLYKICIIIVYMGARCSVNWLKQMLYYKKLIIAHNKKHASREIFILKSFIYKEKCRTFTKWDCVKIVSKCKFILKNSSLKYWLCFSLFLVADTKKINYSFVAQVKNPTINRTVLEGSLLRNVQSCLLSVTFIHEYISGIEIVLRHWTMFCKICDMSKQNQLLSDMLSGRGILQSFAKLV